MFHIDYETVCKPFYRDIWAYGLIFDQAAFVPLHGIMYCSCCT